MARSLDFQLIFMYPSYTLLLHKETSIDARVLKTSKLPIFIESFKNFIFSKNDVVQHNIWDKIFKNGPSKVCGRQPLKNLKCSSDFLKAVFHKFYLVHSWVFCPICSLSFTRYFQLSLKEEYCKSIIKISFTVTSPGNL